MTITIVLFILGLTLSFVCSLAEACVASLTDWELRALKTDETYGRKLLSLFHEPAALLVAVSLGNTIATGLIAGVCTWNIIQGFYPPYIVITTGIVLLLVIGEFFPKALVMRRPYLFTSKLVSLIELMIQIGKPFYKICWQGGMAFLDRVKITVPQVSSEERYEQLIEMAAELGSLGGEEKMWIMKIIKLDQNKVREIMRPRTKIQMLPDNLSFEQMIQSLRCIGHTRVPLYNPDTDSVVAIINAWKMLLYLDADKFEEFIELPSFVPETMPLASLLRSLQIQKRGMALVVDEFGNLNGLITVSDILDFILASQVDNDELRLIRKVGPQLWEIEASVRLDLLKQLWPEFVPIAQVNTIGGLILYLTGEIPSEGATVEYNGFRFKVLKADEKRVYRVLAQKLYQ